MSEPAAIVTALMRSYGDHEYVRGRVVSNDGAPAELPTQTDFWRELVLALASSQQTYKPGSPLYRLENDQPFRLALDSFRNMSDEQVAGSLAEFRFGRRIARYLRGNYDWLFGSDQGWRSLAAMFASAANQRNSPPNPAHKTLERELAEFLENHLQGIGPKQARNLLQDLGLTRYEIPLDSRMINWLRENLGWPVTKKDVAARKSYEQLLDRIQAVCAEAHVLPAIFDAAAYTQMGDGAPARNTTSPGYVNSNGQIVIRNSGLPGTDHLQFVYQLACSACGEVYGANGSDIHERKCPRCGDGKPGLPYEAGKQ